MKRRDFLKSIPAAMLGFSLGPESWPRMPDAEKGGTHSFKLWTWLGRGRNPERTDWPALFQRMRRSGVQAVLPQIYGSHQALFASRRLPVADDWLAEVLRLARAAGLEVHAWMWTMPCNNPRIMEKHPDWYMVNALGESARDIPAYVNYYRFMCPNRDGVREFIRDTVAELAAVPELDGIHLDYIRYPDVILPEGLQPRYRIVQDREFPQYDYCYCRICREKFRKETGLSAFDLKNSAERERWNRFRYDSVTCLVNDVLLPVARNNNKSMTAAVFPNWRMVRQEWFRWNLDAFLPMLYHGFYNEGLEWITQRTQEEVEALSGKAPVYSGLYVPHLSPEQLPAAIRSGLDGGACGAALFNALNMTEEHWKAVEGSFRQEPQV